MTGDIAYKPVEATIENEKEIIYTIVINDEEIKVSNSHPFWVENEQTWIAAEDLYVGDMLQTSNGQFLPITDILVEEQTTKVYNLTVSDYHTYFVSETGFWVHNTKVTFPEGSKVTPSYVYDNLTVGRTTVHGQYSPNTIKSNPSYVLRNEMHLAGIPEPTYKNAAHHIIPVSLLKNNKIKDKLEAYNFDINSASNGIFLPSNINSRKNNSSYQESLHLGRHIPDYFSDIENQILKTNNADELIELVSQTRKNLLNGNIPLQKVDVK